MNKTIRVTSFCLFISSIVIGCGQQSATKNPVENEQKTKIPEPAAQLSTQKLLNQEFEQAAKTLFKNRAVSATLYGIAESDSGYHYQSQLEDFSSNSESQFRASLVGISNQLKNIKTDSKIDEENRIVVADIIDYFSGAPDMSVGFIESWMGHSAFLVNQINGPLVDTPNNLINSHTIKTTDDAHDYIERLKKFPAMIQSINSKVLSDSEQGWIPPKIIVQKSLNYLNGFVNVDVEQTGMVASFKTKLNSLESVSEADKQELINRAKKLVSEGIYPGYQSIIKTMTGLLEVATEESGIWAQPNGDVFYRYSIEKLGNSDLSPEEIHQIGLQEVTRITAEMDTILKSEGYAEGTVGDRMTSLAEEPRFLYPNTDEGRAKLLNSLNQTIAVMSKLMPTQFRSVPPYPVKVKRIPIANQDTSAGGYYTPPAIDGSVPGIYWINLRDTKANPKFDLSTLTFHEAIPGHHWQIALNLAQEQLPLLRRIAPYNAYVEGWALYSEQVAYEMGLYKDDPFGNLGRLKAELFRAVRLVVDTGLHAKKWSREQAIDYMANTTGTEKADVVSEIERYMVWPGQALGYKMGMLKILSLREYAKNKLQVVFDIKEFHDVVLLSGAVPMKVLDQNVKAWVESKLKQ